MKAMILAAGLGMRARPLSLVRPKVLFPVAHLPLLGIIIGQLKGVGVKEVIINTHHLAEKIKSFLQEGEWGVKISISYEAEILGTGGGIKRCAHLLKDGPFFVINGDIYHNFDLKGAYLHHLREGNLVTLLLYDSPPFNQVQIDPEGKIVSFGRGGGRRLTFTGIQIISPGLLEMMPPQEAFSIIEFYQELISKGVTLRGYLTEGKWWDIGLPENYLRLHQEEDSLPRGSPPPIHPQAVVSPKAEFRGKVWVGRGSVVQEGALLEDSLLWEEVRVKKGAILKDSICADGAVVEGEHRSELIL